MESLFRRAYPDSLDVIRENALTTFLENSADFRMAVKRTKPQTLQEAVKNAIQEECIKMGESEKSMSKQSKPVFDLDEDPKITPERERYQRNKKPWTRREQGGGGRSNTKWGQSFHNDRNTHSEGTSTWNSSNTHETKDNKDLKEYHLN